MRRIDRILLTFKRSRALLPVAIILAFVFVGSVFVYFSSAATVRSTVKSGNWSDPTVWNGGTVPLPGELISVSTGTTVTYDATTYKAAGVHVKAGGTLSFAPTKTVTLESNQNVIVEGKLSMRPTSANINHLLKFVEVNEALFVGGGMDPIASDVGLWVMGEGLLDVIGATKTPWTNLADSATAGSKTITLAAAPSGWNVGDELTISPTEPPTAGNPSWDGFDEAKITAISGATITLDTALVRNHPKVNNKWTAEVLNLTRNTRIEGQGDGNAKALATGGRSHILIRSSKPQTVSNLAVRYMGPRVVDGSYTKSVLGRYGFHMHHSMDGSRGSKIENLVVRDTGGHAVVPHASHGVRFEGAVTYNTFDDAYWWDFSSGNGENDSHDTVWNRSVAAKVRSDPGFRGYRLAGFQMGFGDRNTVSNSVAVGVQGNKDASGFSWPENSVRSPWVFSEGNITHNNKVDGIFVWHNGGTLHVVENFASYYNMETGVDQGAYSNRYIYRNAELYGNGQAGFRQHNQSAPSQISPMLLEGLTIDGAGITKSGIQIVKHNTQVPWLDATVIRNNVIKNLAPDGIALHWAYNGIANGPGDAGGETHSFGNHREHIKISNTSFDGPYDKYIYLTGFHNDLDKDGAIDWTDVDGDGHIKENDGGEKYGVVPNSVIDVLMPDGETFSLDSIWRANTTGWTKNTAWNAYKKTIAVAGTPLVEAGLNQSTGIPNTTLQFSGEAKVNGAINPSTATPTWSKVSGPGTVSFGNPKAYSTSGTFSSAGTYVIRLAVTANGKTGSDDLTVIVNTANPTKEITETWSSGTAWTSSWSRQDNKPGMSTSIENGTGKIGGTGEAIMYRNTHNAKSVDIKTKLRVSANAYQAGLVARRHDSNSNTYYAAQSGATTREYPTIYKVVNGQRYDLKTGGMHMSSGVFSMMRFQVTDNVDGTTNLKLKVWPADKAEPSDWSIEVLNHTEPALQGISGRFGVITTGGITRTSHYDDFTATSLDDSGTVTPPPPADTTAPTVSLTAPANGSSTAVGSTVTVSANASDNVGVAKVEFYNGSTLLNTDTTSPYSYGWPTSGQTAGSKTLTAKAYDAAGNVATSSAVTLNLTAPTSGNGDANGDGRVNAIDLSIIISKDGLSYPPADFNGDGTVGAADMAILLGKWTW